MSRYIGKNSGMAFSGLKPELRRGTAELFKSVVLFLLFFFTIKTYVIEGYEVQGLSMEPTLHDQDRILVFKLPQSLQSLPFMGSFNTLDSNDIVVFQSFDDDNRNYVKRVIAFNPGESQSNIVSASISTPGATSTKNLINVTLAENNIYVDAQKIDQYYLDATDQNFNERNTSALLYPGQLYVLGDHRSISCDSRDFGPIQQDQVIGIALFRLWPLSRLGWIS
jgi:signal peptidase I